MNFLSNFIETILDISIKENSLEYTDEKFLIF